MAFTIAGGQIIAPDGSPFVALGICLEDSDMGNAVTNAACTPLLTLFPGLNMVRLACYSYQAPSFYETFVSRLTALGIVVELENHQTSTGSNGGGGQGVTFTGPMLATESAWYEALATAFIANDYVWFGTNNEPPNQAQGSMTTWQVATYTAIRGAGSNTIIMVEEYAGGNPQQLGVNNPGGQYPASAYASMSNIVWDLHYYNWCSGYATTVAANATELATMISLCQQTTSKDGVVPVLIGEYGNSTTGAAPDAGGTQSCEAVQQSGKGCLAWVWPQGTADNLTDGANNITPYGKQVAGFIAAAAKGTPPVTVSPQDTTIPPAKLITDALGNLWTLTPGGQVAINGKVDTTTSGVVQMAWVGTTVWQENAANMWWGKTSTTAAWAPANGTAVSPLPVVTPPPTITVASVQADLDAVTAALAVVRANVGLL